MMREVLDRGIAKVPDDVEVSGALVTGTRDALADHTDIDLMVLGSRGYGPVRRVLVGSNSAQLMRNAPCPGMVFPGAKASAAAEPEGSKPVSAGVER